MDIEQVGRVFIKLLPPKKKPEYAAGRKDWKLHYLVLWFVSSVLFRIVIMLTLAVDSSVLIFELHYLSMSTNTLFQLLDASFVLIYITEFALKFYAEPIEFWKNTGNIFDTVILVVSIAEVTLSFWRNPKFEPAVVDTISIMRSLRILRFISFIRGLRVLVYALLTTFLISIIPFLVFLLIIVFVYGVVGYYVFGYRNSGDSERWGNLSRSMLSLITFVTVDGWTDLQHKLLDHGFRLSPIYVISFILLGHFLYTNLFIGIIVSNIHQATTSHNIREKTKRHNFIKERMSEIARLQHRDILRLVDRQIRDNFINFHEMTKEFQKTLRHDDFIYSTDLCTSKRWIDTFINSLIHLENAKYRIKNVHSDLCVCLKEKTLEPKTLST